MTRTTFTCSLFALLSPLFSLISCGTDTPTTPPPPLSDKFSAIQTQTLSRTCAISGCHIGSSPKALLNLEAANAFTELTTSKIENSNALKRYPGLVVAGKPDSSFLYIKLTNPKPDEGDRMPQSLGALPQNELDAIKSWITKGALND